MARVVCQVLSQADRLTLLWSEAAASFPPYFLEGETLVELRKLVDQAHQQLFQIASISRDVPESANTSQRLAEIGHALYQSLFQLNDEGNAPGKEIHAWLDGLSHAGGVERLEIVGDAFALPWTVMYEQKPDPALIARANSEGVPWNGFWGRRFNIVGGRRVQWLRRRHLPDKPVVVLAIDPKIRNELPPAENERLAEFQASHQVIVIESLAGLSAVFQSQDVDLLYLFGRGDRDGLHLGNDRISSQALESIISAETEDEGPSGQTLVFLNACAGASSDLLTAFERFSGIGVIGTLQPVSAVLANQCGVEFLGQFMAGGVSLASALAALRQRYPAASLLYWGSFPSDVEIGGQESKPPEEELLPLPEDPYQPLKPLREDTSPLLVGREFDVAQLAGLLDEGETRLIMVHGAPGVGKASLLHAGLVPFLEDQSVGYRFLRERSGETVDDERDYPIWSIRASSDLIGQIAVALLEYCCRPFDYVTPAGNTVTVDLPRILIGAVRKSESTDDSLPTIDDLRLALRYDNDLLSRLLEAITAQLPFELVLLIEQGEELFCTVQAGVEPRKAMQALAIIRNALHSHARAKFVISLRSEYVGHLLDPLLRTPEDSRYIKTVPVRELTEEELLDVVVQPTSQVPLPGTDEVPQMTFGFRFEQGLPEQIVTAARKSSAENQESALMAVHAVCSRLFDVACRQQDKVARASHLKSVGGAEKGVSNYFAALLKVHYPGPQGKKVKELLPKLIKRQTNGSTTRNVLFEDDLRTEDGDPMEADALLEKASGDDSGLLAVDYLNIGGQEGSYLSLGHDGLASVAAGQLEEARKRSYGRSKMIDVLLVMGSLLIIFGAWALTRLYSATNAVAELQEERKIAKELLERSEPQVRGLAWPAYLGQIHAADQAILAGDLVRARQSLVSLKPLLKERGNDFRGFEWYYLWESMQRDLATFRGHRGTINGVATTRDGQTVATTGDDGTVRLWSSQSGGRQLASFELKDKNTLAVGLCVAISPDGNWLTAGGDDGVVRIWKMNKSGAEFALGAMALATDPTSAAVLASFGQVAAPASPVHYADLSAHDGSALSVAFSPDSKTLASSGKEGLVKLWTLDGKEPKLRETLKEHQGPVLAIAYAPDGKWLASAGADKKAVIWDTAKNTKVETLTGHAQEITSVAWSADGKSLATAGARSDQSLESGIVKLWDAGNWKERQVPFLAVASVFGVAFSGNGKTLVTASKNNAVQFWDIATGKEQLALRGHLGWVRSLAVSRGGELIASGSYDGTAKVWEPSAGEARDLLKVSSQPVVAVVFSPDDRWLATGSADGKVKVWNAATGKEVKALSAHKGATLALAWAADGTTLVSGGEDGKLKLWDVDPTSATYATELDSAAAHEKEITCLDWPEQSKRFASGGRDGNVVIWKVEAGKLSKSVEVPKSDSAVLALAFDDRLNILATGHEDGNVRERRTDSSEKSAARELLLVGHTGPVTALSFVWLTVDEGKLPWLFSGSTDQTVRVWQVSKGVLRNTLRGHAGPVTCLGKSRFGEHTIVSGSTDSTVKLWDPLREMERWTYLPGIAAVRAVALSNDSRTIAAAGADGSVRIFRAGKEVTRDR